MVLWVIGNNSGDAATVTLQDFLRDDNTQVNPLNWLIAPTVQIPNGQIGLIAGIKNPNYPQRFLVDRVKYTIRVQVGGATVDHDPDGDIKP
jgi:hypothetical protein